MHPAVRPNPAAAAKMRAIAKESLETVKRPEPEPVPMWSVEERKKMRRMPVWRERKAIRERFHNTTYKQD